jgi:F-type H+-transporting ATPase subunit a
MDRARVATVTLSPDAVPVAIGPWTVPATLPITWATMAAVIVAAARCRTLITSGPDPSRLQVAVEAILDLIREPLEAAAPGRSDRILPFVATVFTFVAGASIVAALPGMRAPTSSLSTTSALATIVFFAVPVIGIQQLGLRRYLAGYLRPSPWMVPFTLIGEVSRTVALSVRLFGAMSSGWMLAATITVLVPLFVPVVLEAFSLLMGLVQAYIFTVLTIVYVGAGLTGQGTDAPS